MTADDDALPAERRLRVDEVSAALRTRHIGRELHYLRLTDSTMVDARRLAEQGCEHGTAVVADEQTAGRGTKGRSWVSQAGRNILITLVVRPDAEQMKRLSIVAPVAAARAVETATGLSPTIKWPNDLELDMRKFGGILIEGEWRSAGPAYALIGIGLNINFDPAPHAAQIERPATSLMIELGRETSREAVLAALLNEFEAAYETAASQEVFEAWRSRLDTLGRAVQIIGADGETVAEGLAEDATFEGALVLRDKNGARHIATAGEVSLRT